MSMCIKNRRGKCHINVGRGCPILADENLTAWCVNKNMSCPVNGVKCPRDDLKPPDPTPAPTPTPGVVLPCTEGCSGFFMQAMGWWMSAGRKTREEAYDVCRKEIDLSHDKMRRAGCTPGCISTPKMCEGHSRCLAVETTVAPAETTAPLTAPPTAPPTAPEPETEPESTTPPTAPPTTAPVVETTVAATTMTTTFEATK